MTTSERIPNTKLTAFERVKQIAQPARFEMIDLKGWSASDLRKLMNSAPFANVTDKNTDFRLKHGITAMMNSAERQMITAQLEELAKEALGKVSDVHEYYLNKGPCYYTERGLTATEPLVASAWMKPESLTPAKPAAAQVIGMTMALTEVSKKGAIEPKKDFTPLTPLAFQQVSVPGLASVAEPFAAIMSENVEPLGKINGGRDLVDKLHDAITQMTTENYLVLHYLLCCGPFSDHFEWGKMIVNGTKARVKKMFSRKPGHRDGEVIMGVKPNYADHYTDYTDCKTAVTMRTTGQKVFKMFVWTKGFTPKFQVPIVNEQTFPVVYKYMNDCRGIRGTDDKGLSGWSCGFGNTGNPTKIQARHQRKLSVILGAMQMEMTGPVLIHDSMEGETHMLAAQLKNWQKRHQLRNFYFVTPTTATRINGLLGDCRFDGQNTEDCTRIIFPEPSATAAKASEWEKMDMQADMFLREKYPIVKVEGRERENEHVIIGTLLLSERYFQAHNCKVFAFGSLHNMYGYISNRRFWCAVSNGKHEYHLDRVELEPQNAAKFLSTSCVHNGYRTGYFLEPKYFFNEKLNFLRHLKGKMINFDSAELEDATGNDYDSEGDDELWESSDSSDDDQGQGEIVFSIGGKIHEDDKHDSEDSSSENDPKLDPAPAIVTISAAKTALQAQLMALAGTPIAPTVTVTQTVTSSSADEIKKKKKKDPKSEKPVQSDTSSVKTHKKKKKESKTVKGDAETEVLSKNKIRRRRDSSSSSEESVEIVSGGGATQTADNEVLKF
jgi:hypothetical protein